MKKANTIYEEVGELDFPTLEKEILAFWQEQQIFDKLRQKNAGGPAFSFVDGPITANNPRGLGVHHAWGRTYKDAFQRYKAMCGFDQRFQNGFDCQGLWVEVEVEKELGLNGKGDILAYGLERFATACKERVSRSAAAVTENSRRLGQWMDWDHSYYTHADYNVEHIWHFLRRCHEREWLYKGHRVMPWCFRCGTSLSQHEMVDSYRDVVHRAAYLALPLLDRPGEKILVWTTTPWTLCANVALAVHPDLDYVRIDGIWMGARAATRLVANKPVQQYCKGAELLRWRYAGAFDELPAQRDIQRHIVAWSEVSADEGSGVVHIAPACGAEDYELGKTHKLDIVEPLGEDGSYREGFGVWAGRHCNEVGTDIIEYLRGHDLLYAEHDHPHRYPHCWRCSGELVYRLVDEWFIACDELRPRLIEATQTVRWVPDHAGKRMLDWLRNMDDWCISRKRYWGLPLPIYEAANGEWIVVGSRAELRRLAIDPQRVDALPELHRPWIDAVELRLPSGQRAQRISEVGDCWLDAGIVPFSTLGYSDGPNGAWSKWYPADFAVEMREQIRLWFYSMLFMGVTLSGRAPYRTVMCYEKMRDAQGEPMHKSAGNALWFDEAVATSGADPMRWLFAGQNLSTDMRYGAENLRRVMRPFLTLWNVYRFYVQYARLDAMNLRATEPQLLPIDRWLLARLQVAIKMVRHGLEEWDLPTVVREVETFIDLLSNWYVRLTRRRFWKSESDADKRSAYWTLEHVLQTLCRLLAPILPFLSESMYRNLSHNGEAGQPESVHLCAFPDVQAEWKNEELLQAMAWVQEAVVAGRGMRTEAQLKVRQPLSRLLVDTTEETWRALNSFADLICRELNVKKLERGRRRDWVEREVLANLRALGARLGARLPQVQRALAQVCAEEWLTELEVRGVASLELEEGCIELQRVEVIVRERPRDGLALAASGGMDFALDKGIDIDLRAEGLAREFVHQVQKLRKAADLALDERVAIRVQAPQDLVHMLVQYADYICAEVLCFSLEFVEETEGEILTLDGRQVRVYLLPQTR
jgi:isoleucyl-tRNA synthetase